MLRETLGVSEASLEVAVIDQMIEDNAEESQHMEFKSELPANKEFARDVAAMANGNGGVIIVGVEDENDVAVGKTPISLPGQVSRLQQVLNSNVQPFVPIKWHQIDDSSGNNTGFLILEVEQSERIPFAVDEGNGSLGFYIRSGQHKQPMAESQVEQMYRERFRRQSAIRDRVDEVTIDMEATVDSYAELRDVTWLYLVIVPVHGSTRLLRPNRQTSNELERVLDNNKNSFVVPADRIWHRFPRPGFKRIQFSSSSKFEPDELLRGGWIEFHDDGSYLAVIPAQRSRSNGHLYYDPDRTAIEVVERLIVYYLLSNHLEHSGEVLVHAGVDKRAPTTLEETITRMGGQPSGYPIQKSISTRLHAKTYELAPGPELICTAKILLDDLFTAFGWPECPTLEDSGEFNARRLGRSINQLQPWIDRFLSS